MEVGLKQMVQEQYDHFGKHDREQQELGATMKYDGNFRHCEEAGGGIKSSDGCNIQILNNIIRGNQARSGGGISGSRNNYWKHDHWQLPLVENGGGITTPVWRGGINDNQ